MARNRYSGSNFCLNCFAELDADSKCPVCSKRHYRSEEVRKHRSNLKVKKKFVIEEDWR